MIALASIRYAMFVHSMGERALCVRYTIDGDRFAILTPEGDPALIGPAARFDEILAATMQAQWEKLYPTHSYVGELKLDLDRNAVSLVYADIKDKLGGAFDAIEHSPYGRVAEAQAVWLSSRAAYTEEGAAWMSYTVLLREDAVEKALEVAALDADGQTGDLAPEQLVEQQRLGERLASLVVESLVHDKFTITSGPHRQ